MTNDLVKRLRETTHMYQVDCELKMKCADRIEELEAKLNDQTHLIEQFFALLDITEQTDEGRYFKPNRIYSHRVMDAEKLEKVLVELKRSITEYDKSKEQCGD
jgi:hypothetical protein